MKYTIKSRKLGKSVTFSRPGEHYVYVDLNGKPGSLGNQICVGGKLTGNTIMATDENFKKICDNWFRKYREGMED